MNINASGLAYGTVAAAMVDGVTSELTGECFESGAMTAAFGRLFNEFVHRGIVTMQSPADEVGTMYSKDVCTPGPTVVDPVDGRTAYYAGSYNVDGQGLIADYTIENLFTLGAVAKAGLGLLATTADGFLARGFMIRAPFDIPVQRFGAMSLERPDFWGLRIGSSKFANRVFAAIKPEWNNLSVYTRGVIPRGTPIRFGLIGNQGWRYPGGSLQFITESRSVVNQTTRLIGP